VTIAEGFGHRFELPWQVMLCQHRFCDGLDQLPIQQMGLLPDQFDQGGRSQLIFSLDHHLHKVKGGSHPYLRHGEGEAGCDLRLVEFDQNQLPPEVGLRHLPVAHLIIDLGATQLKQSQLYADASLELLLQFDQRQPLSHYLAHLLCRYCHPFVS
jgi:hypothetical protein